MICFLDFLIFIGAPLYIPFDQSDALAIAVLSLTFFYEFYPYFNTVLYFIFFIAAQ